jgi:hypothetical protein
MIKSKFSFWFVYFVYGLLCSLVALSVRLMQQPKLIFKGKLDIETPAPVMGAILITFSIAATLYLLKFTTQISVSAEEIKLKKLWSKEIISFEEIDSISLFDRKNIGFLSQGIEADAIRINAKTGKEIILSGLFYSSFYKVRQALHLYYPAKIVEKDLLAEREAYDVATDRFVGNYFTSFNGIIYWVATSFFVIFLIVVDKSHIGLSGALLFGLLILSILYLALGSKANYFVVYGNTLIIKNHLFFWKAKTFELNTIRKIVLDQPRKASITLNLYLSNFRLKKFQAGSLREKHWKTLIEFSETLDIPVVKETSL